MWRNGKVSSKELSWAEDGKFPTDDIEAHTVYPDIIVHLRGESGSAGNILVVEAKRNYPGEKRIPDNDRKKLVGFTDQKGLFQYRCGAFLNFRIAAEEKFIEIKWFVDGMEIPEIHRNFSIPPDDGGKYFRIEWRKPR